MGKLEVKSPLFNLSKRTKSTDEATSCNFVVPEAIMDTDALDNDPQVAICVCLARYQLNGGSVSAYVYELVEYVPCYFLAGNERDYLFGWENDASVEDTLASGYEAGYFKATSFGVCVRDVKKGARLRIKIPIYKYDICWDMTCSTGGYPRDTRPTTSEYATIELDLIVDDENVFACEDGAKVGAVYNLNEIDSASDLSFSLLTKESDIGYHKYFEIGDDEAFALPQPPDDNTGLILFSDEIYWEIDNCPVEAEDVSES